MYGQLGVPLPTGGITESYVMPTFAPNETISPFPMQLGTGTLDTYLAKTYLVENEFF